MPMDDSSMTAAPADQSPTQDSGGGADGINKSAVKGEPGTGFEKAGDLGEFECGNCSHFDNNACHQSDMMEKSQQPKNPDGSVQVAEEDCCEYVDRVGQKESTEKQSSEQESLPPDHPLNQLRARRPDAI